MMHKPTIPTYKTCIICGEEFKCSPSRLKSHATCSSACKYERRQTLVGKRWLLVSPEGKSYQFRNLSLWISENSKLFDAKPATVYHSLLTYWHDQKKTKKLRKWKGWTMLENP